MPQWMPRNARGLVVRILVAGRATQADGAFGVGAADHQRGMRMTIVALRRPLAGRVAIQAAWRLAAPTSVDEQRTRAFGLIRDRRECLGSAQILVAGERSGRACHNDDD